MSAEDFWKSVASRLENGAPVAVVAVVANTRDSPGTLGARLLVDAGGTVEGTIGGGIMEVHVIEAARQRVRDGLDQPPTLQRLVHRKNQDVVEVASGLICAGEQTNLNLMLLPERDAAAVRRWCTALAQQSTQAACLRVDARGVRVDVAPGDAPPADLGLSATPDGTWCYREWSINPRRLAIVGAGHCGRALARLAVDVGYWVDVFDTRPSAIKEGQWPAAARMHVLRDDAELASALQRKAITTVVVMTASVMHDIGSLAAVANDGIPWLGVMGSKAKLRKIRDTLAEHGVAEDRIAAIHGPIGLRMKSDTPPEIAVSVMAQLLTDLAPSTAKRPRTLDDSPVTA